MSISGRSKTSRGLRRARPPKSERYEQVLAAAFKVFAVEGYAATRLDDVAQRAGVAKGTIYLYFKDKEQLFRAVVRSLIQKRIHFSIDDFQGSPSELLLAMLARMYTNVVKSGKVRAMVRMLVAESGKFPQLAEIYHREIIGPSLRTVRAILRRGIASGEFGNKRILEFPQILVGPAVLAAVWKLLHGERHRLDVDSYMHAHMEFLTSGLQGKPAGKASAGAQRGWK